VSFFIKNLFRDAETVLFGSNAVGLSLPTSDIDVMILNLPCKNKEEAC
jgi:DNA polymerase sigma